LNTPLGSGLRTNCPIGYPANFTAGPFGHGVRSASACRRKAIRIAVLSESY
jgi:hypothetical protein